jgi:hypothetical protein
MESDKIEGPIKHLVMFSGGICSWATAKRVVERHGVEGVVLLFADTMIEDEDLYRFVDEAIVNIGARFVRIADGRTPWQVFNDVKFMGNSQKDPCSRILKRDLLNQWREENCDIEETVTHFGLDWTEEHRLIRVREKHAPWKIEGYMSEAPYMEKNEMIEWLKDEGIEPPRLYGMGFNHNNCGGFCIKSGQAQFELLLRTFPERYATHEEQERLWRETFKKDNSILKDRRGGKTKTMTLTEFRERVQANLFDFDSNEWGGCGCAVD